MKNKAAGLALAALLSAAAALPARAELLRLERLRRPVPRFTLKLDLFRGGADMGATAVAAEPTPAQAEILQRSIADEIAQSISYEGSIMKNTRTLALLNVSGEFFTVGEGDAILDKIRILKITRQVVTIEYDGQPYEIRIKGDQNG